jgi:phage shock protein A
MPGLSGRMSTVVKAKISHLLDRAEDPAETLDYSYEKQLEQLQNVKQGIADIATAKKRLQSQEANTNEQIAKLDDQARQAVTAGREDLARAALERKHLAEGEMQSLDQQVAELEDQQQKLIDSEKKLQAKMETFRTKKEVVKAQYSAAEAQTETMKARADAVSELEAAGTFEDLGQLGPPQEDIDRQLEQLGRSSAVDEDLAKLKAELGQGTKPAPQLDSGAPAEETQRGAPADETEK